MSEKPDKGVLVTRENVEELLDSGRLCCAITTPSGIKWWRIRRNGRTKTWRRDALRLRIPFKAGRYCCGAIEASDFLPTGLLNPKYFRALEATP